MPKRTDNGSSAPAPKAEPPKSTEKPQKAANPSRNGTQPKIFVLDTSVVLFDHNAILNFDEHDVVIPITVLEELDTFKKGHDTKNYEARQFIRFLDKKSSEHNLTDWNSLNGPTKGQFKVVMDQEGIRGRDATEIFGASKNDHKILNATLRMAQEATQYRVVLVTKDVNLRLKARALNIPSEDYETGKVKDVDALYSGKSVEEDFDQNLIDRLYKEHLVSRDALQEVRPEFKPAPNHFYILKGAKSDALACFNAGQEALEQVGKKSYYGIKPRNAEQAFALYAVGHPDIKLVTLTGVAGTGKTLLALAGALEQRRHYKQVYLARPIVPLSNKDIGYLPGDMKAKINPYMQPLWDNLKFIKNQFSELDKEYKQIDEMLQSEKLLVTPLAYIRGRSLSNVIFIVDEAQNLTPHEVKTIITRAGENAKFIFTGDVQQIDTPYLDEQSNGLSYLVDRIKGNDLFAHITLEKGERSELANLANDLL
jgi:PhoH-like ATPase